MEGEWERFRDLEWRLGILGRRCANQERMLDGYEREAQARELFIPMDLDAERCVIGCALLIEAGPVFKKLWDKAFYDDYHRWIWGRFSWAHKTKQDVFRMVWSEGGSEYAREKFGANLGHDLARFSEVFAHNVWWYASRVEGAYRHRKRILDTAGTLERHQQAAREAARRGYDVGVRLK